jgi:transposase
MTEDWMEIITGVERRRRWRPEQKLRILAELDEPGTTVAEVARRHEVSRGLLWQWRDAQRRGDLMVQEPAFLPMRVLAAPEAAPAPPRDDVAVETDRRIEIVLPDGTTLRVSETVGAVGLHRVLAALRR